MGKPVGMDRGGSKHNPRVDDEMKKETEAITRGSPVEPRAEEAREMEAAGEDQPQPDAVIDITTDPAGTSPSHGEIEHRSDIARFLRPSVFPGTGEELAANADANNAPAAIVAELKRLPRSQRYENVQQVWEALGGRPETRSVSADHPPAPD
jgi:uncharacterized protein DUF2795